MKNREEIHKSLISFKLPRWKDLPDFDIYMDQVIFYINQELSPLFFEEKVINRHLFLVFEYTNHDVSRLYIKTAL